MNNKFPSSFQNHISNPDLNRNPNFSHVTQQSFRARYMTGDFTRRDFDFPRNPFDARSSIPREMEKERIRAELIAEDMIRRRILEEEVRREMMFEREMSLRRGEQGFGIVTPGAMRLEPQRFSLLTNSDRRGGLCSRFDTLPFQRDPVVVANGHGSENGVPSHEIKEVRGVLSPSEGSNDKVIILAKPSVILADIKRKSMAQPVGGAIEVCKKQKTKDDWSCALCRITATSERGLNEHLQGKKHKIRERGMISQRTGFGTEPLRKVSVSPLLQNKVDESSMGKADDAPSLNIFGHNDDHTDDDNNVIKSKETSLEAGGNGMAKMLATDKPKKRFRYFCEMCQIGAYALKVFNAHKNGKKHLANLSGCIKTDNAAPVKPSTDMTVIVENKEAKMVAEETKEGTEGEQVETKGDDVDGDVNQVETKGGVVDGAVNQAETKGDDADGELNQVEIKGDDVTQVETEGDDADGNVNKVETKGDEVVGDVSQVEIKGEDVVGDVNQVDDSEKVLELVGAETAALEGP